MMRRLFFVFSLALLSLPARAQEKLDLTILHTNDLHGHVLPFAYTEPERSKTEQRSVGGAARRATLIREIKKRTKNPLMVIDCGDIGTRGPLTNAYEGIADIEALNATGVELAVIGNNEFKLKDASERFDAVGAQRALLAVLRRSHFPWVCANAGIGTEADGQLIPGVHPYMVREFNGVRVGFLGLTAPRSAGYPQVKGWWVGDPVAAAKKWIPLVRKECDVLIALTHIGTDDDKKLAEQTSGIDVIIGGDSHTFLYKPVVVNGVPIVQTGEFGVNLGQFDLHFTKGPEGWKLARYDYTLLPVGPHLKEAADVKMVAERFAAPLLAPVAQLETRFVGKTPAERTRKTAEAVAYALQQVTGAELGLHVEGDGFFEVFRSTTLTRYDIYAVMPFKNKVATLSLSGAELSALREKAKGLILTQNNLDPARTYTVAVVDFTATGTLGIAPDRLTDTRLDLREAVILGLRKSQNKWTKNASFAPGTQTEGRSYYFPGGTAPMNEESVCLDFLLRELRRWQGEGRIPIALAQPLLEEYSARRAALEPPRPIPPIRIPAPTPLVPPQPRKGFIAFLEERNIAALHLVGSLLLLAGLVLLVQWQWDGIGRFLLLAVLALSSMGLLRLSDQLQDEHPQSARVLSLLGLLLVPLCGIATRVFGLVGALSWPLTILFTSALTGGVTLWRLRRTEEPILIGLLAAAGAGAVWGGAGLLPTALVWPTGITGLLSLATLSFWGVGRGKPKWDLPCTLSGHALTLLGIGSGLLWAAQAGGSAGQAGLGLTLLGAAGLYGFTGNRLQIPWLGFAASATAALGAQLLVPESASLVVRGATLAATGVLASLVARFQDAKDTPYHKSAEILTLLGLFPLLLDLAPRDFTLVGLFVVQALLWLAAAPTERGRTFAALHALAATRLLAIPLDSWFVSITHLSANEPRWLLLSALALGLLGQRRVAVGALVWAGLAQLPGFFSTKTAPAASVVLLIEALGLGLWGLWQKQPRATRGALVPLGAAALLQWIWWATGTVLLPLPVFALAFAVLGSTFIDRQSLGIRALLWLLAAGHLAASLLPSPLLPFWALALVPVLLWLDSQEDTDEAHLRLTEFFTGLSFLAFALLPSGLSSLSIAVTGSVLSLVPLRRHTASGVVVSMVLATATTTLTLSGYPHPHLSLPQVGLLLAGISALWQGLAAALRRRTPLWETISHVGVAITGIAVLTALTGLGIENQGRWTILALLVSAATLGATAGIQGRSVYAHSAFACAFSAYALYFYDRFGLGIDRFDFFFLPLGLYLLFVAERTREGALRGIGLLSLLGPSLLAVCADPASAGHAFLLTLECLLAVMAGIHQRVKVYLGGGVLFLIALLVIKLWDPLRQINFGVYLTLLGVGVLVAAIQFEKRRDQLRRWASSMRETYEAWD